MRIHRSADGRTGSAPRQAERRVLSVVLDLLHRQGDRLVYLLRLERSLVCSCRMYLVWALSVLAEVLAQDPSVETGRENRGTFREFGDVMFFLYVESTQIDGPFFSYEAADRRRDDYRHPELVRIGGPNE